MGQSKIEELYMTKLVSLFLFRLVHDDSVEEFHLDRDMWNMTNVWFKVTIKGIQRPTIVILHSVYYPEPSVEHDRASMISAMYDLTKLSGWFLDKCLKQYGGKIERHNYVHVFYTTARVSTSESKLKPYDDRFAEHLNNFIGTGDNRQGVQINFTDDEARKGRDIILESEFCFKLGYYFSKFFEDQSMRIMYNEYIKRYHVLLAQRVVHISDILTEGSIRYRELTLRPDLFLANDKFITKLRDHLCAAYTRTSKFKQRSTLEKDSLTSSTVDCEETLKEQISEFLSHPSATTLGPLIEKDVISGHYTLQFNIKRPNNDLQKLDLINSNTTGDDILRMIKIAKYIAVKKLILSLKLKVPVTFGNIDLVLTRKSVKRNRRLRFLAQSIVKMCETSIASGEYNIVTINENEVRGFLSVEDGIGSAIGNLFVYDEATELLQFTENVESLQAKARALYDKLKNSSIAATLSSYRFNAKTIKHFPKLELDSIEDLKAFWKEHLVIFEQQESDHNEVENILKEEIARQFADEQNVSVLSDKMFMYCHSAVQEWWMTKDDDRTNKRQRITKSGYT